MANYSRLVRVGSTWKMGIFDGIWSLKVKLLVLMGLIEVSRVDERRVMSYAPLRFRAGRPKRQAGRLCHPDFKGLIWLNRP